MNRTLADPRLASPEVIAIASQKGGVGKSTTALNLSIALVAAGRTVLLMDLDPQGQAGLTLMSGVLAGGTERMLREANLTREMMTATEIPDLFLVPAGPGLSGIESELALLGDSRTRLHQALATLPSLPFRFDDIVIDCPPSVGLLTLNALAAAHKILLPVPCESFVLESLPTLLKTIGRLRAGLQQPLLGVHLLLVRRTPSTSDQALVNTLRQDYGHIMLLTEIPFDDAVRDAAERGQPLLTHCLQCDVSQAYLDLAAEWLLGHEEHQQPDNGWSFRTRQERMTSERDRMCTRIQAWLMDPSSLLYDETWEAGRQQDTQVFDELFRPRVPKRRTRLLAPLLLLLALSIALLLSLRLPDAPWRNGLAELLPGTGQGVPNPEPFSADISVPAKPEPVDELDSLEPLATAGTTDAADSLKPSETAGILETTEVADTLALVDEPDPLETVEAAGMPETADNLEAGETAGTMDTMEPADEPGPPESSEVAGAPETADNLEPMAAAGTAEAAEAAENLKPSEAAGTPETAVNLEPMAAAETTDAADTLESLDTPDDRDAPFMGDETEDAAMTDIVDTLLPATPEPDTELLEIRLPPLPDYRWDVQVLAGRSLDRVREDSEVFMRKYAAMLKNLRLAISRARFGDTRDDFYRLRVMGWDSQRAAADWCGNLRSRGQKCLVVRVVQGDG
ncbi:AAA family ATPase [Thiocystis violascens]|uniref:ATPase involved in chromosome partitioning n=1 Tax=Thiocystis violascens (strain ATCC 17096 / DSM 198 / 6111) TaxID=765911 RepID=I3Y7T2_THIV6|nr:AAA family ATPase [Thiocystis violascens]AFL73050.1 ATPase involved in chromosome partitioning [Thiocystis violascens DSM 198]